MKKIAVVVVLAACAAVLGIGGYAWAQSRPKVHPVVVAEAGAELPSASAFLLSGEEAAFAEGSGALNTNKVGEFPVEIVTGGRAYPSVLQVVDTAPPQAIAVNHVILSGDTLQPADFVTDVVDATPVGVTFANEPDFITPGGRMVEVLLSDSSGNETAVSARLTVFGVQSVTVEAGSDRAALTPGQFVPNLRNDPALVFETELRTINFSRVNVHTIKLRYEGSTANAELRIIDTTPPMAETVAVDGWAGDALDPMEFIENIDDYSRVTAAFATAPDFELVGAQTVEILLTDAGGNTATYTSTLTLKRDTEPPKITGEIHKRAFIGDAVAYRAGVSVTDNHDTSVALSVDSGTVNVYAAGVYPVVYSAKDRAGNRTAVNGSVTVYAVSEEQVYEMADAVLAKITTEDMTMEQKARAIFTWVRMNVKYVNTGEKDEVIFGAYRAMTKHSGDCYTFYAISEVLLTRADIPNLRVTRIGGRSNHYWQIVNIGTGWHHFDTTPHEVYLDTFMFTESQAEAYTQMFAATRNYYVYDKTLVPEVVQ